MPFGRGTTFCWKPLNTIFATVLFAVVAALLIARRRKQMSMPCRLSSGWIGNYALGASYIALPWWCGQSLFGELNTEVMVLSVLYSLAGLGIAIVNDFKSIEGDRDMGLMSLPVQFGIEKVCMCVCLCVDVCCVWMTQAPRLCFPRGV